MQRHKKRGGKSSQKKQAQRNNDANSAIDNLDVAALNAGVSASDAASWPVVPSAPPLEDNAAEASTADSPAVSSSASSSAPASVVVSSSASSSTAPSQAELAEAKANKEALAFARKQLQEMYTCPVTLQIFHTPVMLTECGHTVEEEIAPELDDCPCCRVPTHGKYVINQTVRSNMNSALELVPDAKDDQYQPAAKAKAVAEVKEAEASAEIDDVVAADDNRAVELAVQAQAAAPVETAPVVPAIVPPQRVSAIAPRVGMFNANAQQERRIPLPIAVIVRNNVGDLPAAPLQVQAANHPAAYDLLEKTLMIGSDNAGKTAFLNALTASPFNEPNPVSSTIGIDFKHHTVPVDNYRVKFQIWDTAGQQRFRTITSAYYRGAQTIMVFADCNADNQVTNTAAMEDMVKQALEHIDGEVYRVNVDANGAPQLSLMQDGDNLPSTVHTSNNAAQFKVQGEAMLAALHRAFAAHMQPDNANDNNGHRKHRGMKKGGCSIQ